MKNINALYDYRFSEQERIAKDKIWQVLCRDFFQRLIDPEDTLLELACGFGEFSRHIRAKRKVAVDLNPESRALVPDEIEFHDESAQRMDFLADDSIDACFARNFFERLSEKRMMDEVLQSLQKPLLPRPTALHRLLSQSNPARFVFSARGMLVSALTLLLALPALLAAVAGRPLLRAPSWKPGRLPTEKCSFGNSASCDFRPARATYLAVWGSSGSGLSGGRSGPAGDLVQICG